MTDKYLPTSTTSFTATAAPANTTGRGIAVGSVLLEPEKWAAEYHKLSVDYAGEPEQMYFLNAARRFRAIAQAYPTPVTEKPDGFVVVSDDD